MFFLEGFSEFVYGIEGQHGEYTCKADGDDKL
jgi:hypothetical protein